MQRIMVILITAGLLVSTTALVEGQPIPIWHNRVDDLAGATADGGAVVGGTASFVPGFDQNALAGDGSVYIAWDNTDVANLFDAAWNNTLGSTIDLFFSGDHWDTHTGDSGFWSVVDRGTGFDGHLITSVRDGSLRFPYRDSYTNVNSVHHLTGVPLANNTVYRLTVRQKDGVIEVYLDGGAYTNAAPVYTGVHPGTCSFPSPNTATGASGREMNVANRSRFFGGILQAGEWVDNIRVYNGYYTPAEIPVAAAGLPVAIAGADVSSGFVPLTVNFDGSASYDINGGTITGYQWDFENDGANDASGATVSHQYTTAGNYICKLTVTDNNGNTAVDVVPVQVQALPATGLLMITAMEPSGTNPAGSYPLTSVTSQRAGSAQSFTTVDLVGPPDVAHVEVTGAMTGGGAGAATAADAFVGLELGSTVSGLSGEGEFLAGYFADHLLIVPDGTAAPEVFVIESSATTDSFQIQLLTNGPGAEAQIATTVQVRAIDYVSTSTVIGSTPRGGVGLDLDALGVPAVRGVRLTGADGFGGSSGVDPVLVAALSKPCNTPAVDHDGDQDVDMDDFAVLQRCLTRADSLPGSYDVATCFCFDAERDQDVDEFDLRRFTDCATGPGVVWQASMVPDCVP